MHRRFHLFWMLSLCGTGMLFSSRADAQASAPGVMSAPTAQRPGTEALAAERQRLRGELGRVEVEIDRLKKGERGLRTDYLLRGRLADAEAIARRLTEIDRALKAGAGGNVDSAGVAARVAGPIGDEPTASPGDGPAELEAKADILTDQAHRAQAQAVALKARIDQVRERRELRRRAHQLDSDPFAPLEGSKRRLLTGSSAAPGTERGPRSVVDTASGAGPPPSGHSVSPAAPTGISISGTPQSTVTPSTPSPTATTDTTGKSAGATPVQVRDLLDPAAPSQVRKSGAGTTSSSDLDAMERALGALNARSQYLDAQAKLLRARAHAR
jgi:hypothetical protein